LKSKELKNIPASVRQRLLNLSRETGRAFNSLLQHYAMEEFVERLSLSPHCDRFVLKGGLRLWAYQTPFLRTTQDIDLLGRLANDNVMVVQTVKEICSRWMKMA
jgi:hypothetical protein